MPLRDCALATLIALLWGVNFVVMKFAVGAFPPLLLTALRFGLAALPLVFLLPRPTPWRPLIRVGVAFGVVKFGLLFIAFKIGMPSGLAALVLQTQVFFTVLLAAVLLAERPSSGQVVGMALAFTGLGVVGASAGGAMAPLGPILLTLAAAVAWALANIEVKRAGPLDALAFTVWMSLVPPLPMLALSLIFEGPAAIATAVASVDALSIAAVLYLAYPISVLSVAMWAGLLARNPAAAVTPFILMVPPIGMVTGWATFGETLGPGTLAGCVLVAAGLVVAVIGGRNLLK